ncbi:MAG: helix-turn-helix transcriptional regulator [Clostridia bacterium]|nr:helix-turn-helix transcriptional regulator [Clostridia bacterium]
MPRYKLQPFRSDLNVTRIAYLHYFEFSQSYHTKADSHPFCELIYTDRGKISVSAENYSGELGTNRLLIHRPGERHSLSIGEHAAPNVIIIGFECSCERLDPLSRAPVTLSPIQERLLAQIVNEGMAVFAPPYDIVNTFFMKKRPNVPFGAEQLLKESLERFLIGLVRDAFDRSRASDGEAELLPPTVLAVKNYVDENFASKITLENLCFLFGTNRTSLCAEFKKHVGKSVSEYIVSARVAEAKSLIRSGGFKMNQIAERCGFESAHYFSRQFKKCSGVSPTEYSLSVKSKLKLS